MKKLLFALLLLSPLLSFSQTGGLAGKVPVHGGQVSFRDTITSLVSFDKVRMKNNLVTGINDFLHEGKNKKGALLVNDTINYKMLVQVTDYLEVEEAALSLYTIWTKYHLVIDYSQKDCFVEVRNIVFIDAGKEKDPNPHKFNENAFTAEEMFLKNKYRMPLMKDAPIMVADSFIGEMNALFVSLKRSINN